MNIDKFLNDGSIVVFTDGCSLGNPGAGGWGAVLCAKHRGETICKEFNGGFKLTTNNRMEILALIMAIKQIKAKKKILCFSDSKYLVDAINKGWAKAWKKKAWKKSDGKIALNSDLWQELLDLLPNVELEISWVKAHANIELNEKADALAKAAANSSDLKTDKAYEALAKKM